MADCRIVNAAVIASVENILNISEKYRTNGEELVAALNAAISSMEGETKDALDKFFNKEVQEFVETSLPIAIKGMSELLEANRKNFEDVDRQIAESISSGGQ